MVCFSGPNERWILLGTAPRFVCRIGEKIQTSPSIDFLLRRRFDSSILGVKNVSNFGDVCGGVSSILGVITISNFGGESSFLEVARRSSHRDGLILM